MGNYRDFMSRTECLINALVWSLIPALQIIFFFFYRPTIEAGSIFFFVLLLLLQLSACAFHWYRYLAYDKKGNQ